MNRDLIFRILCSVMTGVCVLLLLAGWITLYDGDMRKEVKSAIREYNSQLKGVDRDDLKDAEELLELIGVNVSPRKILKQAQSVGSVLSDVKISPAETVRLFPSLIGLINVMEDEDIAQTFLGRSMARSIEDVMDELDGYKAGMILLIVLFFATLICGILVTVLHALNKKYCGFTLAGLQFLMLIAFGLIVHAVNSAAEDEFYDKVLRLTAAPWWALILATSAAFIWFFRDKIGDKLFGARPQPRGMQAQAPQPETNRTAAGGSADMITCPVCGARTEADAAFCPNCGKSTKVAPAAVPDASTDAVCAKCGTQLDPDMDFCPNCGTHR